MTAGRDLAEDIPDWRDPHSYNFLMRCERVAFAWEWLRRDVRFRDAALFGGGAPPAAASEWGLHDFTDPRLDTRSARPVWRAEWHSLVLGAQAERAPMGADTIDIRILGGITTILKDQAGQHLLLSDGLRNIRLDVTGGDLTRGSARLAYRLSGIASAAGPLLVLRQALALFGTHHFARTLHPPFRRAARQILLLRAHDAIRAGAGQRAIAASLFGPDAATSGWRFANPSLRSRVQRLVRTAREVASGGYVDLLGMRDP
ncbi:DNA -binding domain-containing protein [Sphingosinicella sp. BN140058]|uniref:DNA -binding domain-containing protein n=1 Tax=Sphingosinicella sp. BN140058 TaxID=1892855 RepID=UPI0010100A50|nr:DUF2285 domain-containing protein [Sphingosinicella sp. BN140058]QAY78100.1 DUF2285 domain-containing protein [Sphingosinicella sp. BN140058]